MNLCPPDYPCLFHPLCTVLWNLVCPYVSLCVCPSHPACGPLSCLECVHAWIHDFMSTWLPTSGPPPMHSLMETWVPLYGSVFVSQSSHFCCHTLFRMCTCISTSIYVHLTPQVCCTPYAYFHGALGAPMCLCVHVPVASCLFPHLVQNVYMHQYMYLCPPDWPYLVQPLCIVS